MTSLGGIDPDAIKTISIDEGLSEEDQAKQIMEMITQRNKADADEETAKQAHKQAAAERRAKQAEASERRKQNPTTQTDYAVWDEYHSSDGEQDDDVDELSQAGASRRFAGMRTGLTRVHRQGTPRQDGCGHV